VSSAALITGTRQITTADIRCTDDEYNSCGKNTQQEQSL